MRFNQHYNLAGQHAFLSASKYHWLNYSEEKLDMSFVTAMAAARGTQLHELAHQLIILREKLPRNSKTLNLYVNDAIGFRMTPEQVLYYSENCFGTADAISFRNNTLRISDLKTGVSKASFAQLEIYCALFCLEYKYKPFDISMECRLYQNDGVTLHIPDPERIAFIMEKIKAFDKRIAMLREEADA